MRRLPIYFLIDVSESMVGEPIELVQQGIATIVQDLKTDPNALETAWISILIFAGESKTLVPLQDIVSFYPPKFPIGSGTSLGKGLGHLMYELKNDIIKSTKETKGDWRPIIFLFTDGVPTDNAEKAIQEWNSKWGNKSNFVAVSIGNNADNQVLGKLTENVLVLEKTDAEGFRKFFAWITSSILSSSKSVVESSTDFELATIYDEELKKIDLSKPTDKGGKADENFVVLSGKCQQTKQIYLMKYIKRIEPFNMDNLNLSVRVYQLDNAYRIEEESYKELTGDDLYDLKVNTEELRGVPTCPYCGNQVAFAVCGCGQIHCIGNEDHSTCPSCGNVGTYTAGGEGFDVNRTQG